VWEEGSEGQPRGVEGFFGHNLCTHAESCSTGSMAKLNLLSPLPSQTQALIDNKRS